MLGLLWVQYHTAIAYGVLLLLEAFLLPGTFYPRDLTSDGVTLDRKLESVKRTKRLRFWVSLFATRLLDYTHGFAESTAASSRI